MIPKCIISRVSTKYLRFAEFMLTWRTQCRRGLAESYFEGASLRFAKSESQLSFRKSSQDLGLRTTLCVVTVLTAFLICASFQFQLSLNDLPFFTEIRSHFPTRLEICCSLKIPHTRILAAALFVKRVRIYGNQINYVTLSQYKETKYLYLV